MNQTVFALRAVEKSLSHLSDHDLQSRLGQLVQQSYQAILQKRAQRFMAPVRQGQQGKLF